MARKILIRLNIIIFLSFIVLNLVGVFMPELGFDALWYHLTLSKLLLFKHQWYFPGGLFYYSAMPRLAELISLPLFAKLGYIGPKFIQYLSGIIVCIYIFKSSKLLFKDKLLSLVAVNLFYATWLVSWQSSSAYVDLVRTAFEIAGLYYLLLPRKQPLVAGVLFGLAIGTKWHALGSLLIAAVVFSPIIIIPALLVAAPWFYLAAHFTGNPVYPLFEKFMTHGQLAQVSPNFYLPFSIIKRIFTSPLFLTRPSEDFLSPVTGLVFIISLLGLVSTNKLVRRLSLYGTLGTILLLLTPPPSTRYYLPYLPAVILAAVYVISRLKERYSRLLVMVFTFSAIIVFGMRLISYAKFTPLITGRVSVNQFLASQQNRLPNTFIDADDFVINNLPAGANYLISNLHNLYYFPYDFDDQSFASKNKRYDYLITQKMPESGVGGKLIHTNPVGIQIFKLHEN